ncbi:hypothetical protein HD597_011325 [Nonomuraea thailandensis]|uniref:DUF397 domain-containing protein n=1 Tax=Nonomuraea thailandensis TaxID=1188745 RepID=A0A9X2GUN8_9ACTN|nr:DUF397 domain-containing protein [Nonomuraea thailandensis]MCP2364305.1 hypothetical protein [Nonomuraea thailandensis]
MTARDLYALPLEGAQFTKRCGGNQDNDEMESCVEIAPIPGTEDGFAVRDSKNPDAGTLRFTRSELLGVGMTNI